MSHRHGRQVRFVEDLPACCTSGPLRLPRPTEVQHKVVGGSAYASDWSLGLNQWWLEIGVAWSDAEAEVSDALTGHHPDSSGDDEDMEDVLAAHGVHLDAEGIAWVGEQHFIVANLMSDLDAASGREYLESGRSLWYAATGESSDLETLVAPLVSTQDDGLWSEDVNEQWSEAEIMTGTVHLLRSVHVTPAVRGHRLGAWAAAQSIALFDQGRTLVATYAAPFDKRDAIPGYVPSDGPLTPDQWAAWNAEQRRLARHWATTLGLRPLASNPNVLTWHSTIINEALQDTLRQWS